MPTNASPRRRYDHRLRRIVHACGDADWAIRRGVPRSTAHDWIRSPVGEVVTCELATMSTDELRNEVLALRRQNERLLAILRLLVVLVKVLGVSLEWRRVADGEKKQLLLRAIDRSRAVLSLRAALRVIKLSSSRYHSWKRTADCAADDLPSCPNHSPQQITPEERREMKDMATSRDFRHVPTGTLAILAQRQGKVYASPSTWYRFVRIFGWRRPRPRVHPRDPVLGIRASRPNEIWHVDASVIRLLDRSRVYLHAVIDNFSRRILAWRVSERLSSQNSVAVLGEAARLVRSRDDSTTILADAGVENVNEEVDEFLESGGLRRLLAQTEICFSNSLIEAWWRMLKHQWLFLNTLDSLRSVHRLVSFYVTQYNSHLPHSAFCGQTPDEMYFGGGERVPRQLAVAKRAAWRARLAANRAASCVTCE